MQALIFFDNYLILLNDFMCSTSPWLSDEFCRRSGMCIALKLNMAEHSGLAKAKEGTEVAQ
jgi:hypothetical protein